MSVSPIRRPRYSGRGILYTVQRIANEIAKEHGGKVPDIFFIDTRLKREFEEHPELIDLDKFVRDSRKHWERANNMTINKMPGSNLFVPGAYVTLGKRMRGQMKNLDPITDAAAWMQKDEEIRANFDNTMDRHRRYQLQIIDEGNRNRDCKTLGELEAKLRGWKPSSRDDIIFSEEDDATAASFDFGEDGADV